MVDRRTSEWIEGYVSRERERKDKIKHVENWRPDVSCSSFSAKNWCCMYYNVLFLMPQLIQSVNYICDRYQLGKVFIIFFSQNHSSWMDECE